MSKIRTLFLALGMIVAGQCYSQIKVLFDASKGETANNADWIIDSDNFNLTVNKGKASIGGKEANPQRIPTPAQSGITASTVETFWKGALSSWGIDCVKQGYQVETLPYDGKITYGDKTNAQDLTNYKVFVVCEPNFVFTATEKVALLNFVQNGGGLFMVSDHDVSDRDGDGWDSPHIWNDLLSNNTVKTNPFGITFDYANLVQGSTNIAALPKDSVLHGPIGDVTEVAWFNGTTMTLSTTANASVVGQIRTTGTAATSNTNVMFATARYGKGKVAAIGDSSPCDDGSGDSGDSLYDGYIEDANGNHRSLLMNATIWLATDSKTPTPVENVKANELIFSVFPNPLPDGRLQVKYQGSQTAVSVDLIDMTGTLIRSYQLQPTSNSLETQELDLTSVKNGAYICRLRCNGNAAVQQVIISNNR